MKSVYLLRLDDACPTMDSEKWDHIERILDNYGVKPMVGVIPANADPKQQIDNPNPKFWNKVKHWEKKGWAIALHGYDHCYISQERGINPLWPRSEFAGVPIDVQKEKIRNGIAIFASHGISPKYFFAPSHTFDENTLTALRECSDIRIISDTIGTKPYRKGDFIFFPQLGGHCMKISCPGIWTFCLHPSTMTDESFTKLQNFLNNANKFISFDKLSLADIKSKSVGSKLLSWLYFTYRKIRGL